MRNSKMMYRPGAGPSADPMANLMGQIGGADPSDDPMQHESPDSDPAGAEEWRDKFEEHLNAATPEDIKWALMRLEEKRRLIDEEEPETEAPDEYSGGQTQSVNEDREY